MHKCASGARGINRPFPDGPLLRHIGDIVDAPPVRENIVRVRSAKVLLANYRAILHDFPHVFLDPENNEKFRDKSCTLCIQNDAVCPQAIDSWLITNAAFVSEQQAKPNNVNSVIDAEPSGHFAYRPPRYNRALVVEIEEETPDGLAGLLDIKGSGVGPSIAPSHAEYSNGLEYGGVALGDYFYGTLVDRILQRCEPNYWSVPVYAVLDLGFDITNGWFGTAPASLHVRRAHRRHPAELPMSSSDTEKLMLHLEIILRSYGLTTASPSTALTVRTDECGGESLLYAGKPVAEGPDEISSLMRPAIYEAARRSRLELVNVQMTKESSWTDRKLQLVDFGHFLGRKDFIHPFSIGVSDTWLNVGHILCPGDEEFVQPIREIALDPDITSRRSVNAYGFYAAQAFRSSDLSFNRTDIEETLRVATLRAFNRSPQLDGRRFFAINAAD